MKLSTIVSGAALALSSITPASAFSTVSGWPPSDPLIQGYEFTSSAAFTSDGKIIIGGFIQGSSHAVFALTTAGAVSWTRELSDGGILSALGQECSPTIGRDGTIYIGSWDEGLYALNPSNGQKKGSVYFQPLASRKGPLRTCVAIDRQNRIYVFYDQDPNASQPTAHLTCLQLNSDGTIPTTPLWEWPPAGQTILGNAISSPAVDGNGRVYIATREIDSTRRGWVFAIDGSSGSPVLKWQFPSTTGGPDDPDCIGSVVASPIIGAEGTVYIGTQSGFEPGSVHSPTIFALDPDVGTGVDRVKWSFPPSAGGHQELVGAFDASQAISSDGIIYAVSDADASDPLNKIPPMVYAIDSLTGAELWRLAFNRVPADNGKTGDNAPVIAANGDIFVKAIGVNTFGSLVRLSALDGTILEETQIFGDFDTFHAQFDMPYSQLAVNSSGQVFVSTTSASDSTANPPVGIKLIDSGITGQSFWPKWRANNFSSGSVQDNKWTTNTAIGVSITTLLPGSNTVAQTYAVNSLGTAVGYHTYHTPTNIYFLPCFWGTAVNPSGNNFTDMQQVHPLDYPNNMFGINDANQCVGVESYLGGANRGIVYSSLTATPQLLALPSGFSHSSDAFGICKGGPAGRAALAVGDALDSSSIHHAVQWDANNPTDPGTDLGSLAPGGLGAHSYAYGVNSRNWVVGYSQLSPGGGYRAFAMPFRPTPGIDAQNDNIGGADTSIATAINGPGQIVGGSNNGATAEHAYLWRMKLVSGNWTVAAKVDLGAISGGTSRAAAINNRGQVVGFYTVSGVSKAFIWLPGWSTIRDLRNFLAGSDFTTWTTLTAATGISDDGCVIGYGQKSGSTGLVPFAIRVKP